MAPFACPNPVPASERRRLRNANIFFFSILSSDLNVSADLFRVGSPVVVGGESGSSNPNGNGGGDQSVSSSSFSSSSVPSSSSSVRGAAWSKHRGRRVGGGGGARREDSRRPVLDFEEQLYAALGALLEVNWRVYMCVYRDAFREPYPGTVLYSPRPHYISPQ